MGINSESGKISNARDEDYQSVEEEEPGEDKELHQLREQEAADSDPAPFKAPDGGWGWMVVLGCSLMHFLLGGYSRSYGVTYVQIKEKFGSSAAITSWIGGLCVGLRFFLGPIATALSEKYGTRPVVVTGGLLMAFFSFLSAFAPNEYFLFFSYSFGTAFGGTLIYSPALVLVNHYFDKRRSIATGLSSAGSGLGVFCFPPLMEILFNEYGFSGAFMILGAICLHNCISGALYRPLKLQPKKMSVEKKNSEILSNDTNNSCASVCSCIAQWLEKHFGLSHLKDFVFGTYCLAMMMITLSYVAGHQLLLAIAQERGVPESKAVFLLSIVGITDTVGRIFSGFVFDLKWFRPKRKLLYCVSVFFSGLTLLFIGFATTYPMFVVVCAIQGFFNGVVVCQRAVVIVDIVGVEKLSSCFGLCVAFQGFGVVFGPMIAGLLYDIYQTYTPSYIFIGVCSFIGTIIVFASTLHHEINAKKEEKEVISLSVA